MSQALVELRVTRRELESMLSGDGVDEAWVTVPIEYNLTLGEGVLVRIQCEGVGEGVYLEGVAHWKRATAVRGQRIGVGVRVMTSSLPRWRYLRSVAAASTAQSRRHSMRYPARIAVILVTAPRGSTRIYPCALADVSLGGASLAMKHRLEPGEQGRCEWAMGARTFAVIFTVVWSSEDHVGIRIDDSDPDAMTAWRGLVETTGSQLESRKLSPRRDRVMSASVRAAPLEGEAAPRVRKGTVPERAVIEIETDPKRRDPRRG